MKKMKENRPQLGFGIMRKSKDSAVEDMGKWQILIDEYMKAPYCYFDTHPDYLDGWSQIIIRELVTKRFARTRFLLANKMPYYGITDYSDYERWFHSELITCGVDYFDYYMLHCITSETYALHNKYKGFDYLYQLKDTGRTKKIGISFHGEPELLDLILQQYTYLDFVQIQINYMDWDNPVIRARENYEVALKYNKEILVMEPMKGGGLVLGKDKSENAKQALLFLKHLQGISVILSGMTEKNQIVENRINLSGKEETAKYNYARLISEIQKKYKLQCTGCRYCVKECKKNIQIPEILSLLNSIYQHGENDITFEGRIRMLYESQITKGKAEECVSCGLCEKKCPQKIEIKKYMKEAVKMLGKECYYTSERNTQILISLLKDYGIKKVIISPGATNISFAYSVQQDVFFEIYSVPDERSAAYIACGLAEESGEPVVISCTGATASRNYLPGLTEAYYRGIPILAVTSSQERSKIGNLIPQVIDRTQLQNDIVKLSVELPSIKDDEDERNCLVLANKAINELWHHEQGPVHVNLITSFNRDFSIRNLPKARKIKRIDYMSKDEWPQLVGSVMIFCGSHDVWSDRLTMYVDCFCTKYNAKVICDHTSNYTGRYRCTPTFWDEAWVDDGKIDILIHIGKTSGAYFSVQAKEVWRISKDGEFRDTFKTLKYVYEMQEEAFFSYYVKDDFELLDVAPVDQTACDEVAEKLPFSNAWMASQMSGKLPKNACLHLGILNSLRVWNHFHVKEGVTVHSNVGGFGIDGCVSTLIGASFARKDRLYFGVVGDLAFFYDMNVLGNRNVGNNVRLLIINNGGGAEFKMYNHLAKKFGKMTEPYIAATGHYGNKSRVLIKDYAEDLGFEYYSVQTKQEFEEVLPTFLDMNIGEKSMVVEAFTDFESESKALQILNGDKDEIILDIKPKEKYTVDDIDIDELENREVILWGSGNEFHKKISKINSYCKIRYVCDNDEKKWEKEIIPEVKCVSPQFLMDHKDCFVLITVRNISDVMDIIRRLNKMGLEKYDVIDSWFRYADKVNWK